MSKIYDWGKVANSFALEQLKKDWKDLINNKDLNELEYHKFLAANPHFFLAPTESYLVISKLKLGSEYETDFVVVKEGYSEGTIYEFIEIESPHTSLFDSFGKPTARFSMALQQIMDWRRFLKKEKSFIQKFLPTTSYNLESRIKFRIIIGQRNENQEQLEKRRQYSEENNIEISSYDRLTDLASDRIFFPSDPMIFSTEMESISDLRKKNELANPFFCCIGDSVWKSICRVGHSHHFYPKYINEIIANRTYSKYFELFKQELENTSRAK